MLKRHKLYTLLSRLFMTLFMVVLAVFGARSWTVIGMMTLGGLILDVIRNRLAPEFTHDLSDLIVQHRTAASPGPALWHHMDYHLLIYFGPFALYVLILVAIDSLRGPDSLTSYLAFFRPLHDVASEFMSMSRRHSAQLSAMGYANRIDLAVHLYSIAGFAIIIGTFGMTLAVHKWLLAGTRKLANQGKDGVGDFYTAKGKRWPLCLVALFFYWFWSGFIDVRPSGLWNVEVSNMPYLILVAWVACVAMFAALVYLSFLRVRLQTAAG